MLDFDIAFTFKKIHYRAKVSKSDATRVNPTEYRVDHILPFNSNLPKIVFLIGDPIGHKLSFLSNVKNHDFLSQISDSIKNYCGDNKIEIY